MLILRTLRERASTGVRVRLVLGDPDGRHIARRGTEEGIGAVMAARVRNALILFRRIANEPGVEVRLHDTVLYNSIFRADDDQLRLPSIAHHRVVRTTNLDDGMASTYVRSFERVWASARLVA